MSKVLKTIKLTEEETLKVEQAYYAYDAMKSLITELDTGVIKPSQAKYDELVDKYTDALMAYKMAWSTVVSKKIPMDYATDKYTATVNFSKCNIEITEM